MTKVHSKLKSPPLVSLRSRTYFTVKNKCPFNVQLWVSGDPNARVVMDGGCHLNVGASATGGCLGAGAHFGMQFLPRPGKVQRKSLPAHGGTYQVLMQTNKVHVTVLKEQDVLVGDKDVQV